jgi:transposase
MQTVGIDLHRSRSQVAVLDDTGKQVVSRRITNSPDAFLELLGGVEGDCRVAVEATYGWEWLADLLQGAGYELHLAHPTRTKAIAAARVKTDAVDARTLAQLLRADMLPEAYIASPPLRDLRDLLRHRVALTRIRSALKNRVGAILAKHGIERAHSDLFGPGGRRFLAGLALRDAPRRRLDSLVALVDDLTREIEATSFEIDARADADPYVDVLCQIRGVGRYIAMLIIAAVGDISRFPSARHLCSWAGLTPTVRNSDQRVRPSATSPDRAPRRCAGRSWKHPNTPAVAATRCVSATTDSRNDAASRSRRSRSPARSSPSPTTACATERSVAWRLASRRARSDHWRSTNDLPRPNLRPLPRGEYARASELVCCQ